MINWDLMITAEQKHAAEVLPALRAAEDAWRAIEMPIARENVTAIEFGDGQIPGTAAQWKAYWLALRAWIEGADGYPDATHRPLKPT